MMQAGIHTGEGAELGILSKVSDVQKAMGQLTTVPGGGSWGTTVVPPSREVSTHAAGGRTFSDADLGALAQMLNDRPIHSELHLAGRKFYGVMQETKRQFERR